MQPLVEVSNLTKRYQGIKINGVVKPALDQLTLNLSAGKIIGLLGENGSGGAAHLPGMLAAATVLPVIGVPVPLKHLEGMDSLLSIVQMPSGVPVATVSIGNAKNAALLAARILGAGEGPQAEQMRERMLQYQALLRQVAIDKGEALKNVMDTEEN